MLIWEEALPHHSEVSGKPKCAGAPSDAPARGLLHVTGYFVVAVVGDEVTDEGCSVVSGVAAFGAGWDLDFRPRRPRALLMSSTWGRRSAVSGRLARTRATA